MRERFPVNLHVDLDTFGLNVIIIPDDGRRAQSVCMGGQLEVKNLV
jgi:hypothetical protein